MSRELPIFELESELVREAGRSRRFILTAPTGSGKSTQVPQMLVDRGLADHGEVVILQPRRLAARLLAARVARERDGRLGGEVGYRIRFDDVTSAETRIVYVTEGILLRRILADPLLKGVSAVLFDEFHERHLYGDVTLGMVLRLQETTRPDLLLGVMSATLEIAPLKARLGDCPVLTARGRLYPVDIRYLDRAPDPRRTPPWEAAADALESLVGEGVPGDALVFMPGAYEIGRTLQALQARSCTRGFALLPLHGELSADAQDAAVARSERRKIVVATNVAETSLTIDGVRMVIDSGLARVPRYDPWRGINTLLVESISRASSDQRAGRAGRTAPGVCMRLWTEREQAGRPAAELPEVRRVDLSEAVLLLKAAGVGELRDFPWIDPPEEKALTRAQTLLDDAGAIEGPAGGITELGRRMAAFPMHPRYSRMLLAAEQFGCVREAAWIAALTEGRHLLVRRTDADTEERRDRSLGEESDSDFALMIRAWRHAQDAGYALEACRRLGIHAQAARQAGATADLFLRLARRAGLRIADAEADPEAVARCVLTAFPDHVAKRFDGGTLRCQIVHGRRGMLARESAVRGSPLLVAAEIREIEAGRGEIEVRLSLAVAIRQEWLEALFPRHFTRQVRVAWDAAAKRVTAEEEWRYHDLVLESRRLDRPPAEEAAAVLAEEAVKGRLVLQGWDHAVEQWILRVDFLARVCPDFDLPPFGAAEREFLIRQLCLGSASYKEIKDKPALPVVRDWLSGAQRALVERHAPERIELANGKRAKVVYAAGAPPHIAMRIQELYGVNTTPTIAMGRAPLQVQILAPSHRPVQITQDLRGFWRDAYPKIKQELQRKYPRHEWR
ncbi:MAG: ATP-dependent helicase HrpB [Kiritimatiellia bacterium]